MRWNANWTIIHQLAVKHHANHDVRGEQLSFGTNVAGVSSDQPEVRPGCRRMVSGCGWIAAENFKKYA